MGNPAATIRGRPKHANAPRPVIYVAVMVSAALDSAPGDKPGPLDPTATARFSSRDGTRLYGEWFRPSDVQIRGRCLVIHGYAEHCGRYREVANVLARLGIATLSYDMRGHGRADGQRGHVNEFVDYLDDMDAALTELAARVADAGAANAPLFLLGHSNGGLIALRALTDQRRCPKDLSAAIISSPFLGLRMPVSPVKKTVGLAAARWMPRLSLPNELDIKHLTSDPGKLAERRADTLCHDVASARWFAEALDAQSYVLSNAPRIKAPTLWLVGGGDRIADPSAARMVQARLAAPSEYHYLAGFHHEVFNELHRERPFSLMRTYLAAQLAPRASA